MKLKNQVEMREWLKSRIDKGHTFKRVKSIIDLQKVNGLLKCIETKETFRLKWEVLCDVCGKDEEDDCKCCHWCWDTETDSQFKVCASCENRGWSEIDDSAGDHMTIEYFKSCVECGGFIDSDGFAQLATDSQVNMALEISPSKIKNPNFKIPDKFTHVVWCNK